MKLSNVVDSAIEKFLNLVLQRFHAQATCRPAGCYAQSWVCINEPCCYCVGDNCFSTQRMQMVFFRCLDGTSGMCKNCISSDCGYDPVDECP